MKRILLLSALVAAGASVYAADAKLTDGLKLTGKISPRLVKVIETRHGAATAEIEPVAPGRRVPAKETAKERLDSVVGFNSDGSKGTLMKFVYDDNGWWIESYNHLYDRLSNSWGEPVESFICTRREDGNIISERNMYGADYGVRQDYEYDDRGRGISLITYSKDGPGADWVPQQKGEYTYDDNDNIIEEFTYFWNTETSDWVYVNHNMATWDDKHRQLSLESYDWDGSNWKPYQKYDYRWFDGPYDPDWVEGTEKERFTYRGEYMIVDGEWMLVFITENKFNEDGRIVSQSQKTYNRQYDNFYGGDDFEGRVYFNTSWKSHIEYDERGLRTVDQTFQYVPGPEEKMFELGFVKFEEFPQDNGDFIILGTNQNNIYDDNGKVTGTKEIDKTWIGYNARCQKLWVYEEQPQGANGVMVPLLEDKLAYDEKGNLLEYMVYDYIDGVRTPNYWTSYTYDSEGNVSSNTGHVNGAGGLNPIGMPAKVAGTDRDYTITEADRNDNWKLTNRWEYEYANGMQTKKEGTTWDGSGWIKNQGQVNNFDFSVKLEDLLVPQQYEDLYKIESIEYLTGYGDEWVSTESKYYYSELGTVGVDEISGEADSLTYDGSSISMTSGDAAFTVFDMTGMAVLRGCGKSMATDGLAAGVYVVNAEIADGTNRTLKIVVK